MKGIVFLIIVRKVITLFAKEEGYDRQGSYMVWDALVPEVMLLLLLVLFFFEAFHAQSTVVLDFILCQASLARFALFFS